MQLLNLTARELQSGCYDTWDKVRYRRLPEGFEPLQWWLGLKQARWAGRREIGLRSTCGEPFWFVDGGMFTKQLHEIDLQAGGRIGMVEQVTNPDVRDQYVVASLVKEAITSSQLEGAVTTREVAKQMIRQNRKPTNADEQMILNNFLTMRHIASVKDQPLTLELVCDLHRRMTADTLEDTKDEGRLREQGRVVEVADVYNQVYHTPPDADELPQRLAAMCDFANGQSGESFIHPALKAVMLHFWLAYDHPFVDGNGRTARALFYWAMLRGGYWLFEFVSISEVILEAPKKYYKAFLNTEVDENDLTYFLVYHLDVVGKSIDRLHAYIQEKVQQTQVVDRLLNVVAFNHRQRSLLGHALRHPHQRYTTASHQSSQNVSYQTARNDLLDLAERGLLSKQKVGKTDYFMPVADMGAELARIE